MRRLGLLLLLTAGAACGKPGRPAGPLSPSAATPSSSTAFPERVEPKPPVTADPDVPSGAAAARDGELARTAGAFIDVFVNTAPVFSREGRKIIFTSDREGWPQLYLADIEKPDAPATRLVKTDERVSAPVPTRNGKSIVFSVRPRR
jgi:hypothetical protein